jgi:hypothetical protein
MSDIDLYLDQDNELKFNVSIEGSKPGTPKYRLVFEGSDFSYAFSGRQSAPGEVCIVVPTMKNLMKEGNYRAQLEVMVDDRYFTPLEFTANFEQSVRVVAEHTSRSAPKKVGVTASIVTAQRPQQAPIVENTVQRPAAQAPRKPATKSAAIAEIDGKPITADDLRELIRRGF